MIGITAFVRIILLLAASVISTTRNDKSRSCFFTRALTPSRHHSSRKSLLLSKTVTVTSSRPSHQNQPKMLQHVQHKKINSIQNDVRTSRMSITLLKDRIDSEEIVPISSVTQSTFVDDEEKNAELYKTAIKRTLLWVSAAIGYGFLLIFVAGGETSSEFYAGYLLEQSLSIDNLLVFLLLFEYFKIPIEYQNRILNWGIIGSIVMRATMIGFGSVALQNFREVLLVFAGILIFSAVKVIAGDDGDDEEDLNENQIVKFANNIMSSTDQFDGDRFFTEINGVQMATPMLLCMIAVEISDVVFAVDSIPAIFGVTEVKNLLKYSSRLEKTHTHTHTIRNIALCCRIFLKRNFRLLQLINC